MCQDAGLARIGGIFSNPFRLRTWRLQYSFIWHPICIYTSLEEESKKKRDTAIRLILRYADRTAGSENAGTVLYHTSHHDYSSIESWVGAFTHRVLPRLPTHVNEGRHQPASSTIYCSIIEKTRHHPERQYDIFLFWRSISFGERVVDRSTLSTNK
jgi:hypothetical protein